MKKTFNLKKEELDAQAKWYIVDATDIPVGRLATEVATILKGKNKPTYTPYLNCGDFVIVVNADKVRLTGKKMQNKMYWHHSGYAGGIKGIPAEEVVSRNPERVIQSAVKGMIRRGALGHQIINKLKVYKDANHPHAAQMPVEYTLRSAAK